MVQKKIAWLLLLFTALACQRLHAQCNALASAVTIDFQTDQACAPVTVTQFEITYYFLIPQNPADIEIRYEWNDPANTVTIVNATAAAGNTEFTANANFTYFNNNGQCAIIPTAFIVIAGVICPTSEQIQTAFFWGTDEQANGNVDINPDEYEVCFDNPIVNAVFSDNSEFNCNIMVEPDHPNRLQRHVQFVYGTNHNPAATIRNLSLTDGGPQGLTNGAGNLVSPQTRGTAGLPVTAGYFGPVDVIPFPADGPVSVTFPMNAPANVLNAIGNRFEITLFNWNICNPWNGSVANPNYEDAETTQAFIVIVDAPAPDFETRDNLGTPTTDFCVNETIFFANLTPSVGSYTYDWTFFDDAAGAIVAGTSTATDPTFAYTSGGTKLIRLEAENQAAQGSCIEQITYLVNITPALNALIETTDLSNFPITPYFCQNASGTLNTFDVRFHDISTGVVTPTTEWRWEFYDENGVLFRQEPGPGFSSVPIGPFDEAYVNRGVYITRLIVRDNITSCQTAYDAEVRIYENPVPLFIATRVCEGQATGFTESSTLNPINGESIVLREWDFNYDGVTFNKDGAFDNQTSFARSLGPSGTYQVALRVTTDQNACTDMLIVPVTVDPVPASSFLPDITSGCSVLTVNFTNNSVAGQPDIIDEFRWEIDAGAGFVVDSIQHPTDPGFSNIFTREFVNITTVNRLFDVRLRVVTVNGCETVSGISTITVFPGTASGFTSTNYNPFADNCSPVSVDFEVDAATQASNPSEYIWSISDSGGLIDQINTGTTPALTYNFVNSTQALRDFFVELRTNLPSGCFGDSTRVIRISPVPSSAFVIDTVSYTCASMVLNLNAIQKGLQEYEWTIISNGVTIFNSTTAGDNFDYEIFRSTTVDQNVDITLTTRNFANCYSPITTQSIVVPRTDIINADFDVSPAVQTIPNTIVGITDNTNPGPWTYLWDFGDGTTSTSSSITSHTYLTEGTYVINLTVSGNDCESTAMQTIRIDPAAPILDFAYDPASGCAPLTVNFTDLSQNTDPTSYLWEFGQNQGTSNAINPSYTYFEPGVYSVTLTASNSNGQQEQITKLLIIEVFETPSAQFDARPFEIRFPGGILYTDNQSFGATSYTWDFGDGGTSTEFEPQHVYITEGIFEVILIASNAEGCADTARLDRPVTTIRSGQLLIPNAFSPNLSGPGSNGGDGSNDTFIPIMEGVTEFQMLVFNRWGELLFETKSAENGWDGYYQGRLCQQDVYVYKIIAKYSDGQTVSRVGDIHLIR